MIHGTPCLYILWMAAFGKQYLRLVCECVCISRQQRHSPAPLQKSRNTRTGPCLCSLLCSPASLPPSLIPAVPSHSQAQLGGRCCSTKLALKCLPGSPVSPTTQSNHIRSLYLCLGRVRHCSCVHPRSTFGVERPRA